MELRHASFTLALAGTIVAGCASGRAASTQADAAPSPSTQAALAALASLPAAPGLSAPAGFRVQTYEVGLKGPRFMASAPNGDLLVAEMEAGDVIALRGPASKPVIVASGLGLPHGLAFDGTTLYIADLDGVEKMTYPGGALHAVIAGFPENPDHNHRALAVAPDHSLFVSIGSSCNVCDDAPPLASIVRVAGGKFSVYASGLRNAGGLAFDGAGRLWAVVNQRDDIGPTQKITDDLPPDELDLVNARADFGWPRCYPDATMHKRDPNPEYPGAACGGTVPAALNFQAHSAPLGIAFYRATQFPKRYRGGAFVAFHGSWNRSEPTGDKVVFVGFVGGRPTDYSDFIGGWLRLGRFNGRPAGLAIDANGSLYVSDDQNGTIYRVVYAP